MLLCKLLQHILPIRYKLQANSHR